MCSTLPDAAQGVVLDQSWVFYTSHDRPCINSLEFLRSIEVLSIATSLSLEACFLAPILGSFKVFVLSSISSGLSSLQIALILCKSEMAFRCSAAKAASLSSSHAPSLRCPDVNLLQSVIRSDGISTLHSRLADNKIYTSGKEPQENVIDLEYILER